MVRDKIGNYRLSTSDNNVVHRPDSHCRVYGFGQRSMHDYLSESAMDQFDIRGEDCLHQCGSLLD